MWIYLGGAYVLGTAITWGIIEERSGESIRDSPLVLLSLLWPLVGLAVPIAAGVAVGYLPYRLGKFLADIPDRLERRRERLAVIAARLRECANCGEPHDPGDECEEDALMQKSGR